MLKKALSAFQIGRFLRVRIVIRIEKFRRHFPVDSLMEGIKKKELAESHNFTTHDTCVA